VAHIKSYGTYNRGVDRDVTEILKAALSLPPEGRAALAHSLLDSLDSDVDETAEAAWQSEIARRAQELDSGTVTPIPWPEVRARLMATLRNER
jgi:putative addiction module component (TIGR02574 family)